MSGVGESSLRIGAIALTYLFASVPYGVLVARARGVDIQGEGSGNTGATNVSRRLGKKLGAAVLLLDALKGALPVLLVQWRFRDEPIVLVAAGLAAVIGHCHSPWLKFRGGKGVATTLGVYLVLDPEFALLGVVCFAIIYGRWGLVSLGSLVAAWILAVTVTFSDRVAVPPSLVWLLTVLISLEHHANVRRLLSGTEKRA